MNCKIERLDPLESKVTVDGYIIISHEEKTKFLEEFKELTDKYRI